MRTQKEISDRIKELQLTDFLGFQQRDLIMRLEFETAKPYLAEGCLESEWRALPLDAESIKAEMLDYMPFAWEKAKNFRGLSASRSLSHYEAWIWLLGDEDNFEDLQAYNYYGKDQLVAICDFYGWDSSQWDDGVRLNHEPRTKTGG